MTFEMPGINKPHLPIPQMPKSPKVGDLAEEEIALGDEDIYEEIEPEMVEAVEMPPLPQEEIEKQVRMDANRKLNEQYAYPALPENKFVEKSGIINVEGNGTFEASCFGFTKEKAPDDKHMFNQDTAFFDPEAGLLGVCDGMGGRQKGELASRIASEALYKELLLAEFDGDRKKYEANLRKIFSGDKVSENKKEGINDLVLKNAPGSSTTVSFVKVVESAPGKLMACAGWLGDSPIYVRRKDGRLEQVSRDHNALKVVAETDDPNKLSNYAIALGRGVLGAKFDQIGAETMSKAIKKLSACETVEDASRVAGEFKNVDSEDLVDVYKKMRSMVDRGVGNKNYKKEDLDLAWITLEDGDMVFAASDGLSDNRTRKELEQSIKNSVDFKVINSQLSREFKEAEDRKKEDGEADTKIDDLTEVGMTVRLAA
ncbi:MAG TPA: protein phosphatase 2C domain-containing protein [Candidatus Bipolaricaulota bacterium]|nr:protein phosphatase 2C domain-containing protein [Candidatus Bipolaricaulota bacterium]